MRPGPDDFDPNLDVASPSLPLPLSLGGTALSLVLVVWVCRRLNDRAATFVIVSAWLRYVVSTFHQYTFGDSPIGVSWNALVSIAMFGVGLWVVRPKTLTLRALAPIYLLLAVVLVSAVWNKGFGNLLVVFTKFGYLVVLTAGTYDALTRLGDRFMPWLLVAFVPPYVFQAFSVVLGLGRSGEIDGSVSYIGGYNHEAAFSVVLATALLVAGLARSIPTPLRLGVFAASVAGLLFADYRTTIVAFAPFLAVTMFTRALAAFRSEQRPVMAIATAIVLLIGAAGAADKLAERFSDLGAATKIADYITRSPDDFNRQDQQLMSGRLWLWSRYVDAWRNGPSHYRLVGAGPEARIPTKDKYPHNTFVSALYEYGLLGMPMYFVILIVMASVAFHTRGAERWRLVAAHVTFFILNMATMPMWQVEGMILYGILCGYTLFAAHRARAEAGAPATAERSPAVPFRPVVALRG